ICLDFFRCAQAHMLGTGCEFFEMVSDLTALGPYAAGEAPVEGRKAKVIGGVNTFGACNVEHPARAIRIAVDIHAQDTKRAVGDVSSLDGGCERLDGGEAIAFAGDLA